MFHYTGVWFFLKMIITFSEILMRAFPSARYCLPAEDILRYSSDIIYILFILDCVVCGTINIELLAIMLTDFSTFQIQVFTYLN